MTEPTTHLGGAEPFLVSPSSSDHPSPDTALQQWARMMAPRDAAVTPQSIEAHLRQCAPTLDHAFQTLLREAMSDPHASLRAFDTALYAQNLFRKIYEQLRKSESQKATKRTNKKRKLVHAW